MKISRLAATANPCGATHPCASASTSRAGNPCFLSLGQSLKHLAAAVCFSILSLPAGASPVKLAWNPNPETDVTGYRLSYGTSPGSYSNTLATGAVTSATVNDLEAGRTYYFAVKAVNAAGLQSVASNEISYAVPAAPPPPAGSLIPSTSWTLKSVSSEETEDEDGRAVNAFDGNPNTYWISRWLTNSALPPHDLQIDLGAAQSIQGFRYLPRQDAYNIGNIGKYEFYVSVDGVNWGAPAAAGTFANTKTEKEVLFASRSGRYVMLRGLTDLDGGSLNGGILCSVAELKLIQGATAIEAPVNQAPVAAARSATTTEDNAVAIAVSASDADGDALTYSIVSAPTKGTLSGNAPNLTYKPNANANGTDSFSFRASDGKANSNTAVVSITVTAVNDAPVAAVRSATTTEDKAVAIVLSASDADGDALTYSIVSNPSMGTLSGSAPNLTYTPAADANGSDSFSFRVSDGKVNSNTAAVSITVTAVNDAPVAAAQNITTTEDKAVGITLSASDKDGNPLSYSIVSAPTKGTLSGSAPNLIYTPNPDVNGSDSFRFLVNDGTTNSNTATVAIGITAVNDAPVAAAQAVSTAADKAVTILLAASDKDGDPLSYSIASAPAKGLLSGSAPNLIYTPATGASGADSFSFRVSDGKATSNTATVSITLTAAAIVNKPPVFQTALISREGGKTGQSFSGESLAGSASDPDGDALTYSKVSGPAWLLISAAGELSGTPAIGDEGANAFTIRATDPKGAFAEANLQIEVQAGDLSLPWTLGRIGSLHEGATANGNSKLLAIKSSGLLAGAADCGVLTWQTLSGDGEITARINTLVNVGRDSRIGLMIRDSLAENSKHVFIGVDGEGSLRWVRRTNTGGYTSLSTMGSGLSQDLWLRLERSGNIISALASRDGSNWSRIGRTILYAGSSCHIGLALCGGSDDLSSAMFQDVVVNP